MIKNDFNKLIEIHTFVDGEDEEGFPSKVDSVLLKCKAKIKTTKGYTLIANNSDFEKATTNFTIRYPISTITRDMTVVYNKKVYTIEYLNNVDEKDELLEIQAKEVTH